MTKETVKILQYDIMCHIQVCPFSKLLTLAIAMKSHLADSTIVQYRLLIQCSYHTVYIFQVDVVPCSNNMQYTARLAGIGIVTKL